MLKFDVPFTAASVIDLAEASIVEEYFTAPEREKAMRALDELLTRLVREARDGTLAETEAQDCLRVIALLDRGDGIRERLLRVVWRWAQFPPPHAPRLDPERVVQIQAALRGWWDGTDWGGGGGGSDTLPILCDSEAA